MGGSTTKCHLHLEVPGCNKPQLQVMVDSCSHTVRLRRKTENASKTSKQAQRHLQCIKPSRLTQLSFETCHPCCVIHTCHAVLSFSAGGSSSSDAGSSGSSSGGSGSTQGTTNHTSTHTTFAHPDSTPSQPVHASPTSHLLPCPPDGLSLGRSTWTFLHTMAAYYPRSPTLEQQQLMRGMMHGLGEFYPCHICAEHLREQMKIEPPVVTDRSGLSDWLCQMHNKVNLVLGKSEFDCKLAQERWKDGPTDGRECIEAPELPDTAQ